MRARKWRAYLPTSKGPGLRQIVLCIFGFFTKIEQLYLHQRPETRCQRGCFRGDAVGLILTFRGGGAW